MKWRGGMRVALPLIIAVFCLLVRALDGHCALFREFQVALFSVEWMSLLCLAIWCGTLIFLTFNRKDWLLIVLLLIAIVWYYIGHKASSWSADVIILFTGVTLGKGAQFLLKNADQKSEIKKLLVGLILFLVFASWWHLDVARNFYPGTRWTGLWDNPNIYGMLMGAGVVLAIELLADRRWKMEDGENNSESGKRKAETICLLVAAVMMAVGLFFSYSRGAWLGAAIALLYVAKLYKRFKWRLVLPGIFIVGAAIGFFWHSTPDTDQWYLKRLDFSRPSAQHRVAAWKAGFEMMRDYPLGVGWNKAVETYEKNYSPPEGGAAAITMNSYLMLGTELGLPALLLFIAYIHLKFKPKPADSVQVACRAGALVFLVVFWFDGGLFDLPTAALFWILLELGTSDVIANKKCGVSSSME